MRRYFHTKIRLKLNSKTSYGPERNVKKSFYPHYSSELLNKPV